MYTARDMPTMKQPAANSARCEVHTHSAMPRPLHKPAATMAQRSPQRTVMSDAGMLLSSEPRPMSAITSAAMGTEAPSSRATSGMMGRMAPSPRPNNSDGPYTGTAMRLKENPLGGGLSGEGGREGEGGMRSLGA